MPQSSEPRPYRIVRLLGQGSTAQVFEAKLGGADGFERRVALKQILTDHRADASALRSFFDEARLVSGLHHGGIVGVLDYGSRDGAPFQVLELVDGRDARALTDAAIARGVPLSEGLALHICLEVAHALHYVHEARDPSGRRLALVHRDVKPGNILLSWSGDVKLGDFGIAFARERTEHTLQGLAKGTPAYMSPEQCRGAAVDARADVFSLGCVLHALITGASPLANQGDAMRVVSGSDPPLDPALADDVRVIVATATRSDRDARYRSAAALAAALGEASATRFRRDPRTELIAWLDAVRPDPSPAAPPGRLDTLLGAELVLGASGPEGREATVRWTEPAPRTTSALGADVVPAPPSIPASLVATSPGRPRSRGRTLAAALLAAGALASLAALATRSWAPSPTSADGAGATVANPRDAPDGSALTAIPQGLPPPIALVATAPAPLVAPASAAPPRRAPSPAAAPIGAASSAPAPLPALEMPGTLAVGGPVGATVMIDGQPRGLTPKYITLPVGAHRIQVVAADGSILGGGILTLRADHTAYAPLRWSPPPPL